MWFRNAGPSVPTGNPRASCLPEFQWLSEALCDKGSLVFPPAKLPVIRFAWLLLLLLAATARLYAEHLPIKIYTSADGLGSSYVNYLMRDSRGFLWVCTRDGLSRFDGSHFVTYQVGDKNAPPGIEQILETRAGIYWIATTGGLYRFDPNAAPSTSPNSDAGRPILNAEFIGDMRGLLYEGKRGELWMLDQKLSVMTETNGKVSFSEVKLNLPGEVSIGSGFGTMYESQDGSLWLGTLKELVQRYPNGKSVIYRVSQQTRHLRNLIEDGRGRIWVAGLNQFYVIKPRTAPDDDASEHAAIKREWSVSQSRVTLPDQPGEIFEFENSVGSANAGGNALYKAGDGHIWVSNSKIVSEFDGSSVRAYTSAEGLLEGPTYFAEDDTGSLWLGGPNGLMRIDRAGMRSYLSSDGVPNSNVLLIDQTREGRLYLMTRDLSLSFFDGDKFHPVRPSLPSNTDVAWLANPAYQDSAGEWWFATMTGLFRFAATSDVSPLFPRPRAIYNSTNGLKSDDVSHVWEDSNHDLWIVTRGQTPAGYGLTKWVRATEKLVTFTESDGLPTTIMTAFAEDTARNLWFGDYFGEMFRYANGHFTKFAAADGVPAGLISALHVDRQGRLWVGSTQVGLALLDDPTADRPRFTSLGSESGLSSNNVRSLTEDLFGNIYVGTARGVDRLSSDAKHIKHYSTNDGLAGDFVVTSFRDTAGDLWFGTPNGLSRLKPAPSPMAGAPPILISAVRVAGERRPLSDLGSVQLPLNEISYRQNNLQIDFFSIDFAAGESLRYQYKLEGGGADWSLPTDQRSVTFANLQPGTYRFLVRAINADGIVSETPAAVTFRILAPIWFRWWFITLALGLIGAVLFLFYRYRMARMREVNAALSDAKLAEEKLRKTQEERLVELERVRQRIATDLHDDIGSSLTRISLLSEVAQRKGHNDDPENGSLSTIAGLSRELVDSMSDIVWAINPERDSLGDLTQRMRHFAADVFSARGIDFRFDFPDFDREVRVGANFRRELFLIFKEAVNNCVKHSGCTEARIEFLLDGARVLVLSLRDNGSGFDLRSKSNGHGLASMRARAEGLDGIFEVESAVGAGTTLHFQIPLSIQETIAAGS